MDQPLAKRPRYAFQSEIVESLIREESKIPDGPLTTILSLFNAKDLYRICHSTVFVDDGSRQCKHFQIRIVRLVLQQSFLSKRYKQYVGYVAFLRMLEWLPINEKMKWFVTEFLKRPASNIKSSLIPYFEKLANEMDFGHDILSCNCFNIDFSTVELSKTLSKDYVSLLIQPENWAENVSIWVEKSSSKPNHLQIRFLKGILDRMKNLVLVIELESNNSSFSSSILAPLQYTLTNESCDQEIALNISLLLDGGYFNQVSLDIAARKTLKLKESISQFGSDNMASLLSITKIIYKTLNLF